MRHGNLSNIGIVRQNNEDYAWSGINKFNNMAGIVCDGLGGYKGGSAASEITVNVFCERFSTTDFNPLTVEQIAEWIENVIDAARTRISEYIMTDAKLINMATTLVCALVINQKVYIFNVGDSRAWLVSLKRKCKQITVDQNLFNYLNRINAKIDVYKKHKNNLYAITQFIGAKNEKVIKPELFCEYLNPEDYIVLTSDGCHNFIDVKDILDAINFDSIKLENACNSVFTKALANNSNDNLSIVILGV